MSTPTKYMQILGSIVKTDNTLSISGTAADAKAVGDRISNIEADIDELNSFVGGVSVSEQISAAVAEKQDKSIIVKYQADSKLYVTHSVDEISDAADAGIDVKFFDGYEYLNILEYAKSQNYAVFYVDYFDMNNVLNVKYVVVSGNSIMMEDSRTYNVAYKEDLNAKQDMLTGAEGQVIQFNANGKPVATDLVLPEYEAITNEEIDEICGGAIEYAEDVMF